MSFVQLKKSRFLHKKRILKCKKYEENLNSILSVCDDDGKEMLIVGLNEKLIKYDLKTGKFKCLELSGCFGVESLFSHRNKNGKWFIILGLFKKIYSVDLESFSINSAFVQLDILTDSVYDGTSLNDEQFCSVSENHTIIWSFEFQRLVHAFKEHKNFICCVHKLLLNDNIIVSGCDGDDNLNLLHFNDWKNKKHLGSICETDSIFSFLGDNKRGTWGINFLTSTIKPSSSSSHQQKELLIASFYSNFIAIFEIFFNKEDSEEEELKKKKIIDEKNFRIIRVFNVKKHSDYVDRIQGILVHPIYQNNLIFILSTNMSNYSNPLCSKEETADSLLDMLSVMNISQNFDHIEDEDTLLFPLIEKVSFELRDKDWEKHKNKEKKKYVSFSRCLSGFHHHHNNNFNISTSREYKNNKIYCGLFHGEVVEFEIKDELLFKSLRHLQQREDEKERFEFILNQLSSESQQLHSDSKPFFIRFTSLGNTTATIFTVKLFLIL